MTTPAMTKIPSTLATQRGAGYLAEQAATRTVVLTSHGKPTAVVMSPERYDDLVRSLREASATIVGGMADLLAQRTTLRSVDDARERLRAAR